jgi:hypothetical protein
LASALRRKRGERTSSGRGGPHPRGPAAFANRLRAISVLGVNGGRDNAVGDGADILRVSRKVTDLPLFAHPNAGTTPEHIAAMRPVVDAWNAANGFPSGA